MKVLLCIRYMYNQVRMTPNMTFPLLFCPKNSSIDIIPGTFDRGKVGQDKALSYEECIAFLLRMT